MFFNLPMIIYVNYITEKILNKKINMNNERFYWKHPFVIVSVLALLFVTSWQLVAFATHCIAMNQAM
jgi:hypothetical protein